MKKLAKKMVLIAAALIAGAVMAENDGELVDVVATGHGSTVREAGKAALRAAVEQVVGTMVDATTLVENDKLIEDEILSYSGGMIVSAQKIGEPRKSEDGLYSVKMKATVKKGKLKEKLRAASAVNVALDGADLFARMTAAQDNLADAEAMIKNVLAKHTACVIAEAVPGKNGKSPIDLDPKTGELFVNVSVRIDQVKYTQFANEVVEKIGAMAEGKIKVNNLERDRESLWIRYDSDKYPFLVMTSFRTGSAIAFKLDVNHMNKVIESCDNGSLAVSTTLFDSLNNEIAESSVALCGRFAHYEDGLSIFSCGKDANRHAYGLVAPFYDGRIGLPSGVVIIHDGVSSGTFRISLGKFAAEELKSVANVKVKVGHMKNNQFSE